MQDTLWDTSYTHFLCAADLGTALIHQTLSVRPHTNAPNKASSTSSAIATITLRQFSWRNLLSNASHVRQDAEQEHVVMRLTFLKVS
jgi:hypothetical protein